MKLLKLRSLILAIVGVVTIVAGQLTAFSSEAAAQARGTTTQKPAAVQNSTNTLKISPVRTDITIAPGSTGKVTVTVSNITGAPVSLKPIENDFVAGDEKGTPSVILDENSYAPTHSLKRFMVPLKNVTVPANGSLDVTVTIVVPKTAQAGGYFGALRFAPTNPDGSQNVNVGTSVASLILLTVPGDLVEKLNMTNFDIQQNGNTASNFRTPDNLSLFLRFKNEGNVQLAPFGKIYVKKGDKILYSTNFNTEDPKATILPDSARRWDNIKLEGFGKFGKYTVGATFGYGTKGQSIDIEKTIWIIPSTYIFGALIALAVIIALIVFFILFLKSYKKRVLRGSRGRRHR